MVNNNQKIVPDSTSVPDFGKPDVSVQETSHEVTKSTKSGARSAKEATKDAAQVTQDKASEAADKTKEAGSSLLDKAKGIFGGGGSSSTTVKTTETSVKHSAQFQETRDLTKKAEAEGTTAAIKAEEAVQANQAAEDKAAAAADAREKQVAAEAKLKGLDGKIAHADAKRAEFDEYKEEARAKAREYEGVKAQAAAADDAVGAKEKEVVEQRKLAEAKAKDETLLGKSINAVTSRLGALLGGGGNVPDDDSISAAWGRVDSKKADIGRLESEQKAANEKADDLEAKAREARKAASDLRSHIAEAKKALDAEEGKAQKLEHDHKAKELEAAGKKEELEELKKRQAKLAADSKAAAEKAAALEAHEKELADDAVRHHESVKAKQAEFERVRATVQSKADVAADAIRAAKDAKSVAASLRSDIKGYANEADSKNTAAAKAREEAESKKVTAVEANEAKERYWEQAKAAGAAADSTIDDKLKSIGAGKQVEHHHKVTGSSD